ncbi:unnamed protein product [Onchocerca flexuosa]|uniref:ZP domain-containing protein n=1 Tax=Onchocerca flexuosa TaxID=387005 RepID=A0A183HFZ4_9BILA|nr:unnamed protein product [Onchocerca flexuosa]
MKYNDKTKFIKNTSNYHDKLHSHYFFLSIIRHVAAQFQTSPGLETFRIEICAVHNQKISGLVDVPAHVIEVEPKLNQLRYHQLSATTSTTLSSMHDSTNSVQSSPFLRARFGVSTPLVMVCAGAVVVCVGLVTLVLLRPG